MKRWIASAFAFFIVINVTGCGFFKKNFAPDTTLAQRELVYDRALDYIYQVAIDAVNESGTWSLYDTDKTAGKIRAYDSRYKDLFNPDDRIVTILVKPMGRRKTSVRLTEDSVSKLRAGEVINAIEVRMARVDQVMAPIVSQKV